MVLFDDGWPRKRLTGQLVWFICWIAVTGLAAVLKPDPNHHGTHTQLGLPPCPSVLLFHRPCPGCGLTTSWTALVHGNFVESFRAHPLGPLLYIAFTCSALLGFYGWMRFQKLRTESRTCNFAMVGTLIVVLGFGLYRFATTVYTDSSSLTFFQSLSRSGKQSGETARVPEQDPTVKFSRTGQPQ